MGKVRISNYTFDASEKKVTFSDYATINLDAILLIVNVTDNIIIYNFADVSLGGTVATNVLTLTYSTTSMDDADKLLIYYDDTRLNNCEALTDWTAVAQNAIGESGTLDCSDNVKTLLHIQSFLDTETAHTGTRFLIQVSSALSGDEDWQDYTEFVGLIGTANKEDMTGNPTAAGATTITVASTTGYTAGAWRAIKDATLVNSELVFQTGLTTNTNITVLDGTTNEHANTSDLYNIALTQVVLLDSTVNRVRVIVDNTYDSDGSTLNYKIRASKVIGV
jgi:hypothetical protein